MKTIRANIVYPVYGIEISVPDDATEKEIREAIFEEGDACMESTSVEPLITECSEPDLIDCSFS